MLAPAVKAYLSAVDAAAIYVSVFEQTPKSVGVAHDLEKALKHLRQLFECQVQFGWIAWAPDFAALAQIARLPGIMVRVRDDGIKVPKTLRELVLTIESLAERSAIVLTPHKKVVERASALAGYVELVFEDLRTSGQLAQFNAAYKSYRMTAQSKRQHVLPYWKATEQLRRVTIQALIASPSRQVSQAKLGELIAQEFPWFRQSVIDNLRKRA